MTLTSIENFLSTLDPKISKQYRTAAEIETVKFPLASRRMTRALGGGIARGRIATIYGNQSSGKSALMQQSIGLWQQQGLSIAYFDTEGAWDKNWTARLGVDNSNIILEQQKSMGGIADRARPFLQAGIDILVIDSVSQALPEVFVDEKTGEVNDFKDLKQIGAHAKSVTMLCNALHYSNHKTAIVIISQTTTEIGQTYTKQIPHGGKKLLFASSQIVKLASSPQAKEQIYKDVQIGNKTISVPVGRTVDGIVEKNKVAQPFSVFNYDFYYDGDYVGVDSVGEVVDDAIQIGVIKKSGSWYKYEDTQFQGRDAWVRLAHEDPVFAGELDAKVEAVYNGDSE